MFFAILFCGTICCAHAASCQANNWRRLLCVVVELLSSTNQVLFLADLECLTTRIIPNSNPSPTFTKMATVCLGSISLLVSAGRVSRKKAKASMELSSSLPLSQFSRSSTISCPTWRNHFSLSLAVTCGQKIGHGLLRPTLLSIYTSLLLFSIHLFAHSHLPSCLGSSLATNLYPFRPLALRAE